MSPNRATPSDKSNFFSPLAADRPLTIHSWPAAAQRRGSRRASRADGATHFQEPRKRGPSARALVTSRKVALRFCGLEIAFSADRTMLYVNGVLSFIQVMSEYRCLM